MIRYIFIAILLSIVHCQLSIVHSQTPQQLLDEAAAKATSGGHLDIAFTVHMSDGDMQGRIEVQGNKFVLLTPGMQTWFDGKTQWTYAEVNEEVSVTEPTLEELQAINPYAWISLYQQGYDLKFAETAVPNVRKVIMTTNVAREEMQSIVLLLHQTELYPVRISMASRGGLDVVVIDVDEYNVYQQALPDEHFTFSRAEHPGVEVIDLR